MANTVNYIPDGYHNITPYLICNGAADAIEFYKKVFNATELVRMGGPDGKVGHAEIKIGDSHIMLADESPGVGAYAPKHYGGSPISVLAGPRPVLWRPRLRHRRSFRTSMVRSHTH
jgi:PhnB protein